MDIKNIVADLKKRSKVTSPYELADFLGITIIRHNLGMVCGYYFKQYRVKMIFLNYNLDDRDEKFVLAHEIGHAILHPDTNTSFLKINTYLSIDKMEIAASKFAMEWLVTDEDLEEYKHFTTEQLARVFGYHKKLMELRIKN